LYYFERFCPNKKDMPPQKEEQ